VLEFDQSRARDWMTALELISVANQVLFIGLFVAVLWHAIRQPSRASLDTVLLFGSIAAVVVVGRVADWYSLEDPWVTGITLALLNVAPFAMLRLVDDFSGTSRWIQWTGAIALVVVGALAFAALEAQPRLVELILLVWFLGVGGYAAYAFATGARRARGITRTRMTAVAAGAILFIAAIVTVLVGALLTIDGLGIIGQVLALAAVVSFFLGFAPPTWIRRAWREPSLRRFVERSIHLAGLEDEKRALMELERAAADAFGASGASIGLVRPGRSVLRYVSRDGEWAEYADDAFIGGRAFQQQRRIVAEDASAADPDHAAIYKHNLANTVIAAPITADDRRLGVLVVYAERAPIFVDDDLWLLELLADQIAVLLDVRALSAEASTLRSREESARLKEEFLSAAAHDLRTPLTVVLGQAELLERRAARDPSAPADPAGVSRIVREARRLRDLVSELLDAQRLEQGAAVMELRDTDLREVLDAVGRRLRDHGLDVKVVQPDTALLSSVDRLRMEQVLDNLVENALKYTANGQLPEIRLESAGDEARLSVVDHGVGIPSGEGERIFDRFYRASNVQSITDTGMGLGLYICRRIVEGHGGRIRVEPTPGGGSTFIVSLPMLESPAPTPEEASAPWPMAGAEAAADA
jgi:signal transduction histidine kinase